MRRSYVKVFRFKEQNRSKLTFSDADKIRLNPDTNRIELKVQADGRYPLDADLYVATWVTNPEALKGLTGFHADPASGQPAGASARFRLTDGATEQYHDGGAWVAAGASDWNTEAEIAANISTFETPTQEFGVLVNLATTDKTVTPAVEGVCLMMDVDLDYLPSIVGDSLVPSLRETVRPVIDHAMVVDAGGAVVALLDLETAYNIVTVEHAFNYSQDPDLLNDILASYDASQKVVNLNTALGKGEKLWLKIRVEPEVIVNWSNQDFFEVEKIPAVAIDRIDAAGAIVAGTAVVRNVADGTAKVLKRPYRMSIDLDVALMAENNRPLFQMMDQALEHGHENPVLRWRAVDEEITMRVDSEVEFRPRPDLRDEHSSSYSLRLDEVNLWLGPEETIPLTQRVVLTLATSPS